MSQSAKRELETDAGLSVRRTYAKFVPLFMDIGAQFLDPAGEDVWVCLQVPFHVAEPGLPTVIDIHILVPSSSDARRRVQV
jgi:hypothetical protein